MELTSDNVRNVFMSCLFNEGEDTSKAVIVEGIRGKFGFHPDRLKQNEEAIAEFLEQLPEDFRVDKGGGWSFLQAIEDSKGNQWADHENVEQLMTLGLAIGKAQYLLPRDMWMAFPGGMPYFSIDLSSLKELRKKKLDKLNDKTD